MNTSLFVCLSELIFDFSFVNAADLHEFVKVPLEENINHKHIGNIENRLGKILPISYAIFVVDESTEIIIMSHIKSYFQIKLLLSNKQHSIIGNKIHKYLQATNKIEKPIMVYC